GFDTITGLPCTYRRYRERPAVYARSIAEGCLATLDALRWERERRHDRANWLRWVLSGAHWLEGAQQTDGGLPRAWEAGTGMVLDESTSAAYVVIPFLVALSKFTGDRRHLDRAVAAGDFGWDTAGSSGAFAGATLDNPDVVDKEA